MSAATPLSSPLNSPPRAFAQDPCELTQLAQRLVRSPGQARGLPNAAYADPQFLALEYQQLFPRTWVCVGLLDDVPERGDVYPITVAGRPLIVVRGEDDQVRVFHNVCSHRGAQLVSAPCSGLRNLRCPYHSWLYGLAGDLQRTPHFQGFGRHERSTGADLNLRPVPSASWFRLLFVNLDGQAPPFEQHLAPLANRWRAYDFSLLRHGESVGFEIRANWKLVIENYVESYHLPTVHPNLNRYSSLQDHYQVLGPMSYVGQGSRCYNPSDEGSGRLPRFPNLPAALTQQSEYICLFPNVMVGCHADHVYAFIVEPVAVDHTRERFEFFFVGEDALGPELAAARHACAARRQEINGEDIDIVERLQVGRASPAFDGGIFSPVMEDTVHLFQCLVTQALTGVAPHVQGDAIVEPHEVTAP
ncbi:MAG: aromatic ring-hydroxylating dioxygenase subunit alpha [Candidatus Competibacterales bacterium]